MSHILPVLDCPNLQTDLININACKSFPAENLPLTSFLSSDFNTNRILEQNVAPGSGKARKVELVYTQRISEDGVSNVVSTDCENELEDGRLSETYEIDTTAGVEVKRSFNFADLARMCKSNQQFIAETVQSMMDAAARKMETRITAQVALLTGKFVAADDSGLSDSDTLKTIATKGDDGKFTEDAIQEITYSANNSGFCNVPFVFGYGEIYKYMLKSKAVCCANSGIDLAQFMAQNQAIFMPTYRVPAALGTDHFLVIDPGSLFLLGFNKFEDGSGLEENINTLTMGIIVDPKTGTSYNYKAYLNPCGEKLNIFISKAFKVVGLPDDIYATDDRYYGTKGVLEFAVNNS